MQVISFVIFGLSAILVTKVSASSQINASIDPIKNQPAVTIKNSTVGAVTAEQKTKGKSTSAAAGLVEMDLKDEERRKRGGHGSGGGGGGGHGHGKGRGGGAAGPIYFCGYIGSKEGK